MISLRSLLLFNLLFIAFLFAIFPYVLDVIEPLDQKLPQLRLLAPRIPSTFIEPSSPSSSSSPLVSPSLSSSLIVVDTAIPSLPLQDSEETSSSSSSPSSSASSSSTSSSSEDSSSSSFEALSDEPTGESQISSSSSSSSSSTSSSSPPSSSNSTSTGSIDSSSSSSLESSSSFKAARAPQPRNARLLMNSQKANPYMIPADDQPWCMRARLEVEGECHVEKRQAVWQSGKDCTLKGAKGESTLVQLTEADMNEQFTLVIISLPSRLFLLSRVLSRYDGRPLIAEIIIVSPPFDKKLLGLRVTPTRIVSDLPHRPGSLNNRFAVADEIKTEGVMSSDDDLYYTEEGMQLAFRTWQLHRNSIVGISPKHATPGRYGPPDEGCFTENMVLSNAAFMSKSLLREYSRPDGPIAAAREHIDQVVNCEDIAVNFVSSSVFKAPPVSITASEGVVVKFISHKKTLPGLSDQSDHYQERSECMTKFRDYFGSWPLLNVTTYQFALSRPKP